MWIAIDVIIHTCVTRYMVWGGEGIRLQRKQDGVGRPSYRYDLEQYWAAAPRNLLGVSVRKALAAEGISGC